MTAKVRHRAKERIVYPLDLVAGVWISGALSGWGYLLWDNSQVLGFLLMAAGVLGAAIGATCYKPSYKTVVKHEVNQ